MDTIKSPTPIPQQTLHFHYNKTTLIQIQCNPQLVSAIPTKKTLRARSFHRIIPAKKTLNLG